MRPLSILLLILLVGLPLRAWGGEGNAAQLRNQYRELREHAQSGPFGLPLSVQSEDRDDQVSAEVYGIIEHPVETVKAALSSPASWCEFAPLHLNVKACTFQTQSHETLLTLYLGQKYYQTPERASSQVYQFTVHAVEPDFMSVGLSAPKGLFGSTAHRFELEAAGVDGRTVVVLRSSYVPSVVTRVMTAIYLATVGRNRVGFSREDTRAGHITAICEGIQGVGRTQRHALLPRLRGLPGLRAPPSRSAVRGIHQRGV